MVILSTLSYDNFSTADRKHTKYRLNPTYYGFTLKGLELWVKDRLSERKEKGHPRRASWWKIWI